MRFYVGEQHSLIQAECPMVVNPLNPVDSISLPQGRGGTEGGRTPNF